MTAIRKVLTNVWSERLKPHFDAGKLIYERQLQALLYKHISTNLGDQYTVWVEPVIYFRDSPESSKQLEKTKPDIVITNDNNGAVEAIIELKFKPWELVRWEDDFNKLHLFEKECSLNHKLRLGWIPKNYIWSKQKKAFQDDPSLELIYNLSQNTILGFFVGARKDALAVRNLSGNTNFYHLQNLLHLVAYINEEGSPIFKEEDY